MKGTPIAAVMVHVEDAQSGLEWSQRAFPNAATISVAESNFKYLDVQGIQLEIVEADEKVTSGPAGSIVYWATPDFESHLARLLKIGATLYRGPIKIPGDMSMCQVKDPWGNCIGLRTATTDQTHETTSEQTTEAD